MRDVGCIKFCASGEGDSGVARERIFFFPCLYVSRGKRRHTVPFKTAPFDFFLMNSA
jgi:hypothetical protein